MTVYNQEIDQKGCAAVRMAKLPIVRSAWSKLSVLYTDTKRSHPNLKVFCEALENRAVILTIMAASTVSPVMVKLEPQISIVNSIACKSLDWLESTFPFLQAPTEEVDSIAKDKMHEAQEVLCVAAAFTTGSVQHTVERAAMNNVSNMGHHISSVIERAVTGFEAGFEQARSFSEAMVDYMFAPADNSKEEANSQQRFEIIYPGSLLSINTKLCRKIYKAIKNLTWSPAHLLLLMNSLPQYLQYQTAITMLFISQMYNLSCPSPSQQINIEQIFVSQDLSSRGHAALKIQWQESPTWRVRLPKATDGETKSCVAYSNDGKSCTLP